MVASGLTERVVNDKVMKEPFPLDLGHNKFAFFFFFAICHISISSKMTRATFSFQTLSFYFHPCGKIPPPVIMVQHVSFRYSENTVRRSNKQYNILHLFVASFSGLRFSHFLLYSHTFIRTWSLELTWTHGWPLWGPMGRASLLC